MAGEARRLTKRVVDAAVPRAERFHLWDSELAGFGLRIEASGTKTFVVRYRAEGGGRNAPRRFMTVGRYGALTPDEARSKARQILGSVATGHDPAAERSAKRTAMLVPEPVDRGELRFQCFDLSPQLDRGKQLGALGDNRRDGLAL